MDNLIFCLNATVPIFAIIVLGRWLRSKNFFTKQTLTDIDRLSFKVLLPILLFRDIAQGRITEQFDPVFFFFCAGATTVYFFAVWIGVVYLKSFKELFLISKLSFVSESVCKGKRFFLNHQIFFEVFSKKFFSGQKPEPEALLAPLAPLR